MRSEAREILIKLQIDSFGQMPIVVREHQVDLALSELIKLIENIEPFDILDGKDLVWKDSVINLLKGE